VNTLFAVEDNMLASCWQSAKEVPINTGHVISLISYTRITVSSPPNKKVQFLAEWSCFISVFQNFYNCSERKNCIIVHKAFYLYQVPCLLDLRFSQLCCRIFKISRMFCCVVE